MKKSLTIIIAEMLSIILNPFLLGLVVMIIAVYKSKMPENLVTDWTIVTIGINGFFVSLFYWILIKKGFVIDESVDNKKILQGRIVLILFLIALILTELIVLLGHGAYQPLVAVLVGGLATLILGLIITFFWKISWHGAMITFFTSTFIMMYGSNAWPIIFLLILVIWSRLVLKRHNIWQISGGIVISIIIIYLVLNYFDLLHGLN